MTQPPVASGQIFHSASGNFLAHEKRFTTLESRVSRLVLPRFANFYLISRLLAWQGGYQYRISEYAL